MADASGQGPLGAAERSAARAIEALKPAQYLALVLLMGVMFAGLLIYLDRREERRDERLLPIITECLKRAA